MMWPCVQVHRPQPRADSSAMLSRLSEVRLPRLATRLSRPVKHRRISRDLLTGARPAKTLVSRGSLGPLFPERARRENSSLSYRYIARWRFVSGSRPDAEGEGFPRPPCGSAPSLKSEVRPSPLKQNFAGA